WAPWPLQTARTLEAGWMLTDFVRQRGGIGVVALASLWLLGWPEGRGGPTSLAQEAKSSPQIWTVPEVGARPHDADGRLVRRGRDLITATYAHIGPEVADPAKRFAGNNLACRNCHLQAGTKKFGIPLFGLFGAFPHFSARLGAQITIEERLDSCMTRRMKGRPLPAGRPETSGLGARTKIPSTRPPPRQLLPEVSTRHMQQAGARRRGRPRPRRGGLRQCLRRLSRSQRCRHPPQPADHRPRLHGATTLGQRQLQRWRRNGAADHGRKFPPLQHAARRRL